VLLLVLPHSNDASASKSDASRLGGPVRVVDGVEPRGHPLVLAVAALEPVPLRHPRQYPTTTGPTGIANSTHT